MQNPDRFTQGWQAPIGKRFGVHTAPRWMFPVLLVLVALGVGFTSVAVQAQDGGTGSRRNLRAAFALQVNTSDPKLGRLCVGETVTLPVTVVLRTIDLTGTGEIGDWIVHGVQFDPTVENQSIVSVSQSTAFFGDPAPNRPFQTALQLKGEAMGSTTITINATVQSDITLWLDEEVALPIPITSRADTISVPVRVIYCDFMVSISSIWDTSMHGARTALIANAHNLRLTGGDLGPTLRFDPPEFGAPFLEWTWANNRIIGCLPSGGNFSTHAPRITAVLGENDITVTIDYARAVPGGPNSQYYRTLCLPHFLAGVPCEERPDGVCFVIPVNRPFDWFEPQQLVLVFSLNGETQDARHLINHSWGAANGTAIITLTPLRVQR